MQRCVTSPLSVTASGKLSRGNREQQTTLADVQSTQLRGTLPIKACRATTNRAASTAACLFMLPWCPAQAAAPLLRQQLLRCLTPSSCAAKTPGACATHPIGQCGYVHALLAPFPGQSVLGSAVFTWTDVRVMSEANKHEHQQWFEYCTNVLDRRQLAWGAQTTARLFKFDRPGSYDARRRRHCEAFLPGHSSMGSVGCWCKHSARSWLPV